MQNEFEYPEWIAQDLALRKHFPAHAPLQRLSGKNRTEAQTTGVSDETTDRGKPRGNIRWRKLF